MITNTNFLKKYCKNYTKIENYDEAVRSPLKYDLHHRREISESKSKSDLIEENLYFHRPPEELVFLEHGEHIRLHNANLSQETRQKMSDAKKGEKCYMYGKHPSAESRQKMSAAKKGKCRPVFSTEWKQKMSEARKGRHCSEEIRKKMSEAMRGKHWHLENGRRIWTE